MASAANTLLTYSLDPRLPVSPELRRSDPAHPTNVIKRLLETGNQANADAYYDNKPQRLPLGVHEGFANPIPDSILTLLAIAVLIIALIIVSRSPSLVIKFTCIFAMVLIIHFLIGKLEKRAV